MSKAMDEIKEELKTCYPDKNLTDNELNQMALKLVKFFEIGIKVLNERPDALIMEEKSIKK